MPTAEDSGRYPAEECSLCADSGTLTWQQPQPSGCLRTIEMDCPAGCGGHWKHPHAERARVVETSGTTAHPEAVATAHAEGLAVEAGGPVGGNAAAANRIGAEFIRDALERWGFSTAGREHPDR
ncbi:hypothetical protein [Saccharomonospora saliphila]|uniref:hypothetical protein n=1 Tax=Saccharomonospora saliphila TaxID=369829 RepID=UPI000369464D|nr:hypothetical protein [Saccharomonospora saliphila]